MMTALVPLSICHTSVAVYYGDYRLAGLFGRAESRLGWLAGLRGWDGGPGEMAGRVGWLARLGCWQDGLEAMDFWSKT